MLDGAILASGIHCLNDDQHTVLVVRIEFILQFRHLGDAFFQQGLSLLFCEHFMVIIRIEFLKIEILAIGDL